MHVERRTDLPFLSWLLRLKGGGALLICGSAVNTCSNSFFEGVWAGAFADWNFDSAIDVFGSGGRFTSRGWLIVPLSHTLEATYLMRLCDGSRLASNSLVFLLSYSGARFLASRYRLALSFIEIVNGIDHSPTKFETTKGTLYTLHHHNALLGAAGIEVCPKAVPDAFARLTRFQLGIWAFSLNIRGSECCRRECAPGTRRAGKRFAASIGGAPTSPTLPFFSCSSSDPPPARLSDSSTLARKRADTNQCPMRGKASQIGNAISECVL